ncbi:DM13 domain-containing protein [Deinococcus irradiatisoli]|nr:DM13 domain-containing protein [Deinococcus irradiatisoli]
MTIRRLNVLTFSMFLGAALVQSTDAAAPTGTMKDSTMNDHMGQSAVQGRFKSVEAPTSGQVSWSRSDEKYILTATGLKTEPAPDLQVWLYQDRGGVRKGVTNLKVAGAYFTVGTLKKFGGNFSFTVAAKALPKDLSKFNSVLLWCDQVSAAFAVAALK